MYDIRLLTLYKQHYRDVYDEPLRCGYTCWGYYDGLDISDNIAYRTSCPETSILALWYATGGKVSILKGNFSAQNIGLIRHISRKNAAHTNAFWSENPHMPFFAVALIQISDRLAFGQISHLAEQKGSTPDACPGSDRFCRTIAYGSFDNTDLVLFLHSNSLLQLEYALREIEALSEVRYLHSIVGVSELYLHNCVNSDSALARFDSTLCFLKERLPEIHINVVTDGTPDVKRWLKGQLEHWCGEIDPDTGEVDAASLDDASILSKNGHETFVVVLRNIPVSDMLRLFVPGGVGTHQNPLYGKNVYNIATSLLFDWGDLQGVSAKKYLSSPLSLSNESQWCKNLINQFRGKLADAMDKSDESLCSYYQAMFQTLNTLSQYEQFSLSQDLFLTLIPSFNMFADQFSVALGNPAAKQERIKDALCTFLEYANLVIYHTIHTDQIFLMVPGYSGTSFSIPIKLTLLFLWLSWKLTQILNDTGHTYQCILTPVMESRPITHSIDFGTDDLNRLIAIKVSQRLLYLPRHLTIILSHEIAHYVGGTMRCRRARLKYIANLLAYYIGEQLLPSEILADLHPDNAYVYQLYQQEIMKALGRHLSEEINVFEDKEPYADECVKVLSKACKSWLVRQIDLRRSIILNIPEKLERELRHSESTYVEQMQFLAREQEKASLQLQALLASNDCDAVIAEMFRVSREVFSDMVALAILGCTQRDFETAFPASEGMEINPATLPAMQWFRQYIAACVVFGSADLPPSVYAVSKDPSGKLNPREGLYRYAGMRTQFEKYAKDCYKQISQRLRQPDISSLVLEVRKFYHLFTEQGNTCDVDAKSEKCVREVGQDGLSDIYMEITQYISDYENYVKKSLE